MNLKNKIVSLCILIIAFLAITVLIVRHNHTILVFDGEIIRAFGAIQTPFLNRFMLAITQIGNPYQSVTIFIVLGLFLIAKRCKYLLYLFTIAVALGSVLPAAIKILVARPRPVMHLLFQSGFSFPSEHATLASVYLLSGIFLIAPLLKNRFSKIIWLTVCAIIFPLVALSRIYLSVHFASDVIAGILLGSASFLFANIVVKHHQSYEK